MGELWAEALTEITERIRKQNFDAWIKPVRFILKSKNEIVLEVPNKFFRDWLTEHYLRHIETALSSISKSDVIVTFEINSKLEHQVPAGKAEKKQERDLKKV